MPQLDPAARTANPTSPLLAAMIPIRCLACGWRDWARDEQAARTARFAHIARAHNTKEPA